MNLNFPIFFVIALLNLRPARAQSPTAPKFDAAAIRLCSNTGGTRSGDGKQSKGGGGGGSPFGGFSVSPGRLNTGCTALATSDHTAALIQRVYGRLGLGHVVRPGTALPISGGPAWAYSDAYDINAVASANTSEEVMEGPMLQALLEDRFKLKVHRVKKDVPLYALTVLKGGPKLTPSQPGSCVVLVFTIPPPRPQPGQRFCDQKIGRRGPNNIFSFDATTLDEFCKLLTLVLDRPVIDKTGLAGKFDIKMEFAIDQSTPGDLPLVPNAPGPPPPDPAPAPSVFTVIQQLGLKLDPVKGPREFLVIDSIQRPSEN